MARGGFSFSFLLPGECCQAERNILPWKQMVEVNEQILFDIITKMHGPDLSGIVQSIKICTHP